jgi:hypothetical protein
MTVKLWYKPSLRYTGGHAATYNTVEEAVAQAEADIGRNREPAPDRVVDEETGDIVEQFPTG